MPELTKQQILIIIGFILILASIPIAFVLIKNTQSLDSRAQGKKTTAQIPGPVTQPREVPHDSTLADINKLLEASPTPTVAASSSYGANLSFGPTLNLKIAIEGRTAGNYATKAFVGVASGGVATKPQYLLSFTVDFPPSGAFTGLSLAGLTVGSTYTAYIKGPAQIDNGITFVMSPTETNLNDGQPITLTSGDLNEDNTINSADYTIAKNLYGTTSASASWNSRADINGDGVVNNLDLSYILNNFSKTGSSGIWYSSPPPVATGSASLNTTLPIGGYDSTPSGSEPKGSNQGGYWIWVPAM
ncbi:MAG: dockerin type I domain-containing protein [Patescibacteria group bacterium]|nr:dockerin type I domain-containing protein [Patescibacteria group bacterium]